MKKNFIHVCFIIDESGSMGGSVNDVIGGFENVINEQKAVKEGSCSISLYKFNNNVSEIYKGVDVNSIAALDHSSYRPGGCTAMFDGIGTAIDNIGKWLSEMPEDERPEKNLIVIMTDGEENASTKYTNSKVKSMIKEQEEKYNWTFVYLGTDITTTEYADSLGISNQGYSTRRNMCSNYSFINAISGCVRTTDCNELSFNTSVKSYLDDMNTAYTSDTGINLNKKNNK